MGVRRLCALFGLVALASPLQAGKPGSSQPQEIFFRASTGKGTQLVAAARDGSNVSTLFTDSATLYFGYDVGSADSGVIILGTRAGELKLLTYAKNSAGVFAQTSVRTLRTGIASSSAVDLSPDGTRIAYRDATDGALMVYNIADGTTTEWSRGPWAWDFVWARGGGSLVLLEQSNPDDKRSHLYEIVTPGERVEILNRHYMAAVEVSRTDGNVLLLSYNSEDGQQTFVGTWRMPMSNADGTSAPGEWLNPSLAGRSVASRGVLSCDDSYLLYGGAGPAGQQMWFTKTLPSGPDTQISKAGANAIPQSWSRCPTPATTAGDALIFRKVP